MMKVPWIRVAAGAGIILGVAVLLWWFFYRPQQAQRDAAAARVEASQAKAAAQAGEAAVTQRVEVTREHNRIDTITRSNERVIHAAPGAATPVSPDLDRAGRDALCLRSVYQHSSECARVRSAGDGGRAAGTDAGSVPAKQ